MLTPSTLTIPQSGSATCAISTALVSGVPQPIQLSAVLPKNVQATFAPPAVVVGADCIMTVTVGNVTPGTYTVPVTATGTSATHTATLTLIVTASDFSF